MTDAEELHLVDLLDSLVMAAVPKATKVAKYGGTLYTVNPDEKEGQFCGVFPYKAHVQLSFAKGAELSDPDGLLQGDGKLRRPFIRAAHDKHQADAQPSSVRWYSAGRQEAGAVRGPDRMDPG